MADYPNPYEVRPHNGDWAVWIFNKGKSPVIVEDTKSEAIDEAKQLMRSQQRPGAVVFNSSGGFHRFITNEKYWERKTRGYRR